MSIEIWAAIAAAVGWLILLLFVLGLCRAAALGDAMMEEYYAELRRRN